MLYYKLLGRLAVPCEDMREWSRWFETADRTVAKTDVGPLHVSTVFLGLDHNWSEHGPPLLFETMIFDDGDDSYQVRCATWDEAEQCHAVAVAVAQRRLAAARSMLERRNVEC